jgi:hypothetical protein
MDTSQFVFCLDSTFKKKNNQFPETHVAKDNPLPRPCCIIAPDILHNRRRIKTCVSRTPLSRFDPRRWRANALAPSSRPVSINEQRKIDRR